MGDKKISSEERRCHEVLRRLMQNECNKYCADCNERNPTWASWNIGVFVCINCASAHRSLGTHISKVKSVSLDKWNWDQVNRMGKIGNKKAREIYEGNLPENFHRPTGRSAINGFIKRKYEDKRYVKDGYWKTLFANASKQGRDIFEDESEFQTIATICDLKNKAIEPSNLTELVEAQEEHFTDLMDSPFNDETQKCDFNPFLLPPPTVLVPDATELPEVPLSVTTVSERKLTNDQILSLYRIPPWSLPPAGTPHSGFNPFYAPPTPFMFNPFEAESFSQKATRAITYPQNPF